MKLASVLISTKGNKNLDKVVEFFGKNASLNISSTGVIVKNQGCVSTMLKEMIEKACNVDILSVIKF